MLFPISLKHKCSFSYSGSVILFKWLLFPDILISGAVNDLTLSTVLSLSWKFDELLGHLIWGLNDCNFIPLSKLLPISSYLLGLEYVLVVIGSLYVTTISSLSVSEFGIYWSCFEVSIGD